MNNTIGVLLANYAITVLISMALAAYAYSASKERIYLYTVYFWIGSFLNFVLQGLFQESYLGMSLAFWSYIFAYTIELRIVRIATGIAFPIHAYALFNVLGVALTLIAFGTDSGFIWISLPVVTALAGTMLHSAVLAWSKSRSLPNHREVLIYSLITIAHSLHLMDYPFLRMHPDFAPLGFSIGLILLISFSVFLPAFLLKSVSDRYVEKLAELNAKQAANQKEMGDLMSLAQIGELSYSFVHDMASPTTLLMFYSNELALLHGRGLPTKDELKPYSQGIEKATRRLMSLQKMFKTLIKNDSKEGPANVDLAEVIQNCVDLFGPFFRRNQITAVSQLNTTNQVIFTQAGVIDRVLLNLIQNAVNALVGQSREKRITISLNEISPDEVSLCVEDTGPGISSERVSHLWERFGHSDTARKTGDSHAGMRSGGSGFGLFKIKQLTEEIGGNIFVKSAPGVGTSFEVRLPRALKKQSAPLTGT